MRLNRYRRIIATLILILVSSCTNQDQNTPEMDLINGEKAYAKYDISDAEMYFQRFLRKNSVSPERWNVWSKLLNISMNIRQEKVTAAAYLEIMLEEFGNDPNHRLNIELELASVYHYLRNDNKAVELWEKIINNPRTPLEEKAKVYRSLSRAYLSRMEFTLAENTLQSCLELDVSSNTKSDCLYNLAEEQVLAEKLSLAEISLRTLLQMGDVADNRLVSSSFLLGDVLEQQGRDKEALKQFTEIRYSFPNPQVVEKRITYLENKIKKSKR